MAALKRFAAALLELQDKLNTSYLLHLHISQEWEADPKQRGYVSRRLWMLRRPPQNAFRSVSDKKKEKKKMKKRQRGNKGPHNTTFK